MVDPSPHLYRILGQKRGIPDELIDRAIRTSLAARQHSARPILSLNHLSQMTGASYMYLRRIVERRTDPYADIALPKKSGGVRPISAPEPVLMDVQRWILRESLSSLINHPASFAYQRGHSIVDCARAHIGATWLVKMDIHDFFGSVAEKCVYKVFRGRGYENLVSLELARICTRARMNGSEYSGSVRYSAIPTYSSESMGVLPQGGPTSGALANAVATPLDADLVGIASHYRFEYTRYSDDLTFSSSSTFDRNQAAEFIREVGQAIRSGGFELHKRKTRIISPGSRKVVLGLLLDADRVRLLPEFRRRIEVHIRGVRTFGVAHHVESRKFDSVNGLVNYVDGCLSFALAVDPMWTSRVRTTWEA